MKKFLKSRRDYTETVTVNNNVQSEPAVQPKQDQKVEVKPVVIQPPLPPYPPPVDSPPKLNVNIKLEREDIDVQHGTAEETEALHQDQLVTEPERNREFPKKAMCKEFIRGDCNRSICRFSHEVDLAQLQGVFTFCRNYQNAQCTYPYCKFVHATIFEEAEFYRTGILPPHARGHLQKRLPLPSHPAGRVQGGTATIFANTPPPVNPGMDKASVPVLNCVPAGSIEQRPIIDDFTNGISRSSALKREWSEIDESSSSPRDRDSHEHLAKKCKDCEIMEFRLQYNKEKVENMIQSSEEIQKKMGILNKKSNKLSLVLLTLMKPANNMKSPLNSNNVNNDKEKTILEQLSSLINTNSRASDDNVKNIFGTNINVSNLMANLLCGTGDQALSSVSSRET